MITPVARSTSFATLIKAVAGTNADTDGSERPAVLFADQLCQPTPSGRCIIAEPARIRMGLMQRAAG